MGTAQQVRVQTDHANLQWLAKAARVKPKLARWAAFLADYDFVVEVKKGSYMVVPDCLSRQWDDTREEGEEEEGESEQQEVEEVVEQQSPPESVEECVHVKVQVQEQNSEAQAHATDMLTESFSQLIKNVNQIEISYQKKNS